MVPKAEETGFAASGEAGDAELKADDPNVDEPWLANAPNPPVAGLMTLEESPTEFEPPNAEFVWLAGVVKEPNRPGFGVCESLELLDPPSDKPPKPPAPESVSADMGSSELDIDIAIGDGGAGLFGSCVVLGGAKLPELNAPVDPNCVGPAEANPPKPVDVVDAVEDVLPNG